MWQGGFLAGFHIDEPFKIAIFLAEGGRSGGELVELAELEAHLLHQRAVGAAVDSQLIVDLHLFNQLHLSVALIVD